MVSPSTVTLAYSKFSIQSTYDTIRRYIYVRSKADVENFKKWAPFIFVVKVLRPTRHKLGHFVKFQQLRTKSFNFNQRRFAFWHKWAECQHNTRLKRSIMAKKTRRACQHRRLSLLIVPVTLLAWNSIVAIQCNNSASDSSMLEFVRYTNFVIIIIIPAVFKSIHFGETMITSISLAETIYYQRTNAARSQQGQIPRSNYRYIKRLTVVSRCFHHYKESKQ